jgi:hypothetical protein
MSNISTFLRGAFKIEFTSGSFTATNVGDALGELFTTKIASTEKGAANGVATLDGAAKIPVSQLPDTVVGGVEYKSTWDIGIDSPDLSAATPDKGDYYVATNAGVSGTSNDINNNASPLTFHNGDWAIYNGTAWEKVDNSENVTSVFGRVGAIVAADGDYTAAQVVYNNATSGLTATRVQDAIDELDGRIDVVEQQKGVDYVVISSNIVAEINKGYIVDTSGSVTITMPAGPNEGDFFEVIDGAGLAETNNIIIDRNGNNILGAAENINIDYNNASVRFLFTTTTINGADRGWVFSE